MVAFNSSGVNVHVTFFFVIVRVFSQPVGYILFGMQSYCNENALARRLILIFTEKGIQCLAF